MRQHKPTSKEGEAHIRPAKLTHHQKILEALERAKIGCTHEEAAIIAGLRPDQTWKRMSELCRDDKIFDTHITRKLKSGVGGIVWQLKGMKAVGASTFPKTQKQVEANKIIKLISLYDR